LVGYKVVVDFIDDVVCVKLGCLRRLFMIFYCHYASKNGNYFGEESGQTVGSNKYRKIF